MQLPLKIKRRENGKYSDGESLTLNYYRNNETDKLSGGQGRSFHIEIFLVLDEQVGLDRSS